MTWSRTWACSGRWGCSGSRDFEAWWRGSNARSGGSVNDFVCSTLCESHLLRQYKQIPYRNIFPDMVGGICRFLAPAAGNGLLNLENADILCPALRSGWERCSTGIRDAIAL